MEITRSQRSMKEAWSWQATVDVCVRSEDVGIGKVTGNLPRMFTVNPVCTVNKRYW